MKQRILIAFMALSLPLAAFCAYGNVFTADVGGVEMEFRVRSEADKTCFVGGGETSSYSCISKNYVGSIVIPSTVNGYNVTNIGDYAFSGCSNLTTVTIPNSVTGIGRCAFYECSGLISMDIPNSVQYIGQSAFSGCRGLTSVTIGNHVESIGTYAFLDCHGLTSLTIPSSVKSIGNRAFYVCYNLTSVTIPNGVTSIGGGAFEGCSRLSSVMISKSVTSIGSDAFSNCKRLASIVVEDGNAIYDSRNQCNAIIETANNRLLIGCGHTTIPNSVTSIGSYAFYDCGSLTSMNFPNSVTTIESRAFYGCSNLISLNFPNSITIIGEGAFHSCGLTSITISNSITTIGNSAFSGCRLENVLTKNATTDFTDAFSDRTYRHAMLYIPIGTWSDAVYVGGWYQFYNMRETTMTTDALSAQQAYSLVDAETYEYTVYNPENDAVASGKKFYNLDESNPDNAWQIIESAGMKYLYNIGAKKYAVLNMDGTLELSVNAQPVEMENTEEGILLSKQNGKKWLFVTNNQVQTESIPTNIGAIQIEEGTRTMYDLTGRKTDSMQPGINLLRMNDGSVKKVFVK